MNVLNEVRAAWSGAWSGLGDPGSGRASYGEGRPLLRVRVITGLPTITVVQKLGDALLLVVLVLVLLL